MSRIPAPERTEWDDGELTSPGTGLPLRFDSPHTLTDGTDRWPVLEGIPYLRTGREELRAEVCNRLLRDDRDGALVELLRDQDSWAPDPPPERDRVREAVRGNRTLRRAMELLGFGAVADYFTYRLSDPTYLAGLALLQDNLGGVRSSFELACGVGHYSRELARRGVATVAGDVVFAKLWLARRYVTPETKLVCFDASATFPLPDGLADLAFCHDALYFLPEKPHVARELSRLAGNDGAVAVGHTHNAAAENLSSGAPLTVPQYAGLFPGPPEPVLYDDSELTADLLSGDAPTPGSEAGLRHAEAVCLVSGKREPGVSLALPPPGTSLSVNPLYEASGEDPLALSLRWPSGRYEKEYGPHSSYLPREVEVSRPVLKLASEKGVGASPEVDGLALGRVLVDTGDGWL